MIKKVDFHLNDIWEGELVGLCVQGTPIVLTYWKGKILAFKDWCPHQGAKLSEGRLSGQTMVCPRHQYEFDIETGEGINPRSFCLEKVEVRTDNGHIYIKID